MDKKLIKRLKDDPYFQEFQKFVVSKIDELNSISDLIEKSNESAGQSVRIRAMTSKILMEILKPFIDFNEKHEPTVKEVNTAKKKVGL